MFRQLVAAAILTGFAAGAEAAPLNLTTGAPIVEASYAEISHAEFGGDGDLSAFAVTADYFDGIAPTGAALISFGVGYDKANPGSGPAGGFDVTDDNGLMLDGEISRIGFTEDMVELLFTNLSGSAAADFGAAALMLIAFDDFLGENPLAALVDGDTNVASISIASVATVPAPASLLLLASALSLMTRRRRR
ncbi:MAG: PEP-CTERM sorting domain-containing protein [Pikeienuella sp.]